MNINPSNGLITWTPTNTHIGVYAIKLYANDSFGAIINQSFTLNITPVNDAPNITSTPVTNATQDIAYYYDADVIDIDNLNDADYDDNSLAYSLTTNPSGMSINSTTGEILWIPSNAQVGSNDVILQVSDGESSALQSFSIYTANVNDAPNITSTPVTSAIALTQYSYDTAANDIDGDLLIYSLIQKPSGMEINSSSGIITWTPLYSQEGIHNVTINVSDSRLSALQSFTINVTVTNNAPNITSSPTEIAYEDSLYTYQVNAADPNNDILIYNLTAKPEGMSINSTNGLIQWIPSSNSIGENSVIVSVSDGQLTDYQSFSIIVYNTNDAPNITSVPITNATEDTQYFYDVNAYDEDNSQLNYSLQIRPEGIAINSSNGLISWLPDNSHAGENNITITVSDENLTANQSFTIYVEPVNDAPNITSSPSTSAKESLLYTYQITAIDIDNQNNISTDDNNLTYSLSTYPEGMTITSAGLIEWIPTAQQQGSNPVVAIVSDGKSASLQSFSIEVSLIQRSSGGGSGGGHFIIKEELEKILQNVNLLATIEKINKDLPASLKITEEEIGITEFVISVKENVEKAGIEVTRVAERPAEIKEIPGNGKIYQYLKIEKDNIGDEIIDTVKIKFKVDKEWITKYSKAKEDVVLARYVKQEWVNLETSVIDEDEKFIYYESITPGFSYFSITFKEETQESERPKIDKNQEIYSRKMIVPYHIYGSLFKSDGKTQVDYGTDFTFTNLNKGISVRGKTGGGPFSGTYTIMIYGDIGDELKIEVNGWSETFKLTGDKEINFVTLIKSQTEFFSRVSNSFHLIVEFFLVVIIIIFSIKKRKSQTSQK